MVGAALVGHFGQACHEQLVAVEAQGTVAHVAVLQEDKRRRHDEGERHHVLESDEQGAQPLALAAQGVVALQHQCGREGGHIPCRIQSCDDAHGEGYHSRTRHILPVGEERGREAHERKHVQMDECRRDAQCNQPTYKDGTYRFEGEGTAQFAVGAAQYFLGVDAAHAHRGEGGAEVDQVDAGNGDDEHPDDHEQGGGAAASGLQVIGRVHRVVEVADGEDVEGGLVVLVHVHPVDGSGGGYLAVGFFYAYAGFQAEEGEVVLASPVVLLHPFAHGHEEVVLELAVLGQVFVDAAYPVLGGVGRQEVASFDVEVCSQGVAVGEQLAGITLGDDDAFGLPHFGIASGNELQPYHLGEAGRYRPGCFVEVLRVLGVGVEGSLPPCRRIDGTVLEAGYLFH